MTSSRPTRVFFLAAMFVSMAVVLAWAGWIGWRRWPEWRAVREMADFLASAADHAAWKDAFFGDF